MTNDDLIERNQQIADMHTMLAWFELHPEIPLPSPTFSLYAWNTEEEARRMARAMGTFEKGGNDQFLYLIKHFGKVQVEAVFTREQVCERVVTGTREVPEKIIPAQVVEAHTEETFEWRCPQLLKEEVAA